MTKQINRSATAFGILAAVLFGLATQGTAVAATRISYSALVPVTADVVAIAQNAGACPDPDSNARVTNPFPAQWLRIAAEQTNHSDVQILVDLDSVGNLLNATVAKSSGNTFIDQQALNAAHGSKYAPEVRSCNSFKRSYYLDITFDSPTAAMPQGFGGSGRRLAQ